MLNRFMTKLPNRRSEIGNRKSGFTLTELLVAIGLLVVILLAVSTVFRSTGETVSVGLATIEMNRRMLTAQTTLQGDVCGFSSDPFDSDHGMWPADVDPALDTNPPFLFIRNSATYAFPDRATWVAEGSPALAPADTEHLYRQDAFGFFAKGVFKRQTGGHFTPTGYKAPLISDVWGLTNAYIWYGHLRLPGETGVVPAIHPNPGEGTPVKANATVAPWVPFNPSNYFANQWVLGRVAVALAQPESPTSPMPGTIIGLDGYPVCYYGRSWDPTYNAMPLSDLAQWDHTNLAPLGLAGIARAYDTGPVINGQTIHESRFDIAGMNREQDWADYGDILQLYANDATLPFWVDARFSTRFRADPFAVGDVNWTNWTMAADPDGSKETFAGNAAHQVPLFMPGCVNFIVEFAGDYVKQDATTGVVDPADQVPFAAADPHLDGITDFDIEVVNGVPMSRVHWYGFPRDIDGDGTVEPEEVTTVFSKRGLTPAAPMPFENFMFDNANRRYWYSCGWTRDTLYFVDTALNEHTLAPQMLRITAQVIDTEGRVHDGMTRQFVLPVKRSK